MTNPETIEKDIEFIDDKNQFDVQTFMETQQWTELNRLLAAAAEKVYEAARKVTDEHDWRHFLVSHNEEGKIRYTCYLEKKDVNTSSMDDLLAAIAAHNPEAVKQERIAKLREELATLEAK